MAEVKVSIIVPVFNTERYLSECLDSLCHQTLNEIEIIVINDGSTDNSLNIINQYPPKYKNVKVFSQGNKGLGATRNKGIEVAVGKYVYFMDSDDILDITALEECYNVAELYGLDILGFQAEIFGNIEGKNLNQYKYAYRMYEVENPIHGIDFFKRYYKYISMLNTPMCFFSKRFLEKYKLKFLENTYYEDVEFYHHFIACNPKMMIIEKNYYHRRYRADSIMTSDLTEKKLKDRLYVYGKISEISNSELKQLYTQISLRAIRRWFQDLSKKNVEPNQDLIQEVERIIDKMYSPIMEWNFSYLFELLSCFTFLEKFTKKHFDNQEMIDILRSYSENIVRRIGLYSEISMVGIYGMGNDCDMLLDILEEHMGKFKATIVFIDSDCETGIRSYRNCKVFNVRDIANIALTSILITSVFHENIMLRNINRYSDKGDITYSLGRDFGF